MSKYPERRRGSPTRPKNPVQEPASNGPLTRLETCVTKLESLCDRLLVQLVTDRTEYKAIESLLRQLQTVATSTTEAQVESEIIDVPITDARGLPWSKNDTFRTNGRLYTLDYIGQTKRGWRAKVYDREKKQSTWMEKQEFISLVKTAIREGKP